MPSKDYAGKRAFESTPEPPPEVAGDVDPTKAAPGKSFVIHQHHATRLHFDLRLEMMNGKTPVLVSWAVPKNLPLSKEKSNLAVHVEDHPFEYGSFSGSIPKGNYGAGEVRIFDAGTYELIEQSPGKLKFRLNGRRLKGVYVMIQWQKESEKNNWLVRLYEDERDAADALPPFDPMRAKDAGHLPVSGSWIYEPSIDGSRAIIHCTQETVIYIDKEDRSSDYPDLLKLHERIVAIDAVLDGTISETGRANSKQPNTFIASDVLYMDGRLLSDEPLSARKRLLDEIVVGGPIVQVVPWIEGNPDALITAARSKGMPAILAKDPDSAYSAGSSGNEWLAVRL